MSADRWSSCPNCKKIKDDRIKVLELELKDAYGILSIDEWLEKRNNFLEETDEEDIRSLREDWEFYWDKEDGNLVVRYFAACRECGFTFEFIDKKNPDVLK